MFRPRSAVGGGWNRTNDTGVKTLCLASWLRRYVVPHAGIEPAAGERTKPSISNIMRHEKNHQIDRLKNGYKKAPVKRCFVAYEATFIFYEMGILKNRQKCPSAFRHSRHTGIWRNNISCNPGCHAYHFYYGGNLCIAHISVFACCPSTHHPNIFETMFCIPLDCINPLFYNFHINVQCAGAFFYFRYAHFCTVPQ